MQISDVIADMLTRIRNANDAKHESVDIPASNLKKAIAQILLDEGYINGFTVVDDGKQGVIKIALKYGPNKSQIITGSIGSVSAETAAQSARWFVLTAVKNAKTVPMTRCAESAAYASIVSAVRATTAQNAANAKTVWMPSVSAVTDVRTARRSVRIATKNVQTVPRKKSAADATSVRIVRVVTETFAITAKPARCALNLSVSAVEGARSV